VVTAITIPVCAANRLVNKLTSASLLCHWLGDSLPLLFVRWHGEGRQQASIIFREAAAGTQHVSGTPYGLRLYGRRTSVLGAKSSKALKQYSQRLWHDVALDAEINHVGRFQFIPRLITTVPHVMASISTAMPCVVLHCIAARNPL